MWIEILKMWSSKKSSENVNLIESFETKKQREEYDHSNMWKSYHAWTIMWKF